MDRKEQQTQLRDSGRLPKRTVDRSIRGRMKGLLTLITIAAILIIVASLSQERSRDYGSAEHARIRLYGETKEPRACFAAELEAWKGYYAEGARDLFLELPCSEGQYLNAWMQAGDDEILTGLYEVWEGTAECGEDCLAFFRSIKETCPETVFHGFDLEERAEKTGADCLQKLEESGLQDEPAYACVKEGIVQAERYREMEAERPGSGAEFREACMASNVMRDYDALTAQTEAAQTETAKGGEEKPVIMIIADSAHCDRAQYRMAGMLLGYYGKIIRTVYIK